MHSVCGCVSWMSYRYAGATSGCMCSSDEKAGGSITNSSISSTRKRVARAQEKTARAEEEHRATTDATAQLCRQSALVHGLCGWWSYDSHAHGRGHVFERMRGPGAANLVSRRRCLPQPERGRRTPWQAARTHPCQERDRVDFQGDR